MLCFALRAAGGGGPEPGQPAPGLLAQLLRWPGPHQRALALISVHLAPASTHFSLIQPRCAPITPPPQHLCVSGSPADIPAWAAFLGSSRRVLRLLWGWRGRLEASEPRRRLQPILPGSSAGGSPPSVLPRTCHQLPPGHCSPRDSPRPSLWPRASRVSTFPSPLPATTCFSWPLAARWPLSPFFPSLPPLLPRLQPQVPPALLSPSHQEVLWVNT